MERPKIATIKFSWIDEEGIENHAQFSETDLEGAADLIGLMIGEISEGDLES